MSTAPNYQATGNQSASTGAAGPVNWPTHIANDIGILIVETANEAPPSIPTASGYTWEEVPSSPQGTGTAGGADGTRLNVYWARATSSSMGGATTSDSGNHQIGKIITIRGARLTGNPFHVTAGDTSAASTSVSIPGITTTIDNCLVIGIVSEAAAVGSPQVSGYSNGSLTSLTEQDDFNNSGTGNGGGWAVVTGLKATAGVVSATTATLATSSTQARLTLSMDPAAQFFDALTPTDLGDFTSQIGARTFVEPATVISGGEDTMPPVVSGVTPASGSTIGRFQAISFTVTDLIGVTQLVGWMRYVGQTSKVLVYDGAAFVYPFAESTIVDVNGDGTELFVTVVPTGGWGASIAELVFRANDGNLDIV